MDLATAETGRLVNPYSCLDPALDRPNGAATRRANLLAYLEARPVAGPLARWRSRRLSRLPVLGDRLLHPSGRLPRRCGARHVRMAGWNPLRPWSTRASFRALRLESQTLLWNLVPFHPMVNDRPLSNRTPSAAEQRAGAEWLRRMHPSHPPGARCCHRKVRIQVSADGDSAPPAPSLRRRGGVPEANSAHWWTTAASSELHTRAN